MINIHPGELAVISTIHFKAMQKPDELASLVELIDELSSEHEITPPLRILEIGAGNGGTAWCFSKLSKIQHLVSVDLPNGPWGGSDITQTINYIKDFGNCPYTYLAGRSQDEEMLSRVKEAMGGVIDVLFLDGDHSYEGVKKDYELYSPLVRFGGLVAFHDICEHPKEAECEVKRFWDELKVDKEYQEFVTEPKTWGGIGVFKKIK